MILNRSQLRIKSILIALLHLISGNYSLFPTLTLIFPYPRFTATSLHFGLCSLHLCLLCELCCLLPTHTPPKHTWVQKLNTKMQRSNFQNKTRTKQLHQIFCQLSRICAVRENQRSWCWRTNLAGREKQTVCTKHFLILTWINIF